MTSIHCDHPAVIFQKGAPPERPCPDCGAAVLNRQDYPTVIRYLNEERPGAAGDQARSVA